MERLDFIYNAFAKAEIINNNPYIKPKMGTEEYGDQFGTKINFENITLYVDDHISTSNNVITEDETDFKGDAFFVYYKTIEIDGSLKIDYNEMPLDQNYMVGRMADNEDLENAVIKNRILLADLFPSDQEFISDKAEDLNNLFTYKLDGETYLGLQLSPVALDAVIITAVDVRERLGNTRFKQIERFNKKLIAVEAHVTLFITDDGFKMERAYQAINEVKTREIVLFLENDDDYNMFGSVIRVRVGDGINNTARLPYSAIARIGKSFRYDIDPAYVKKILKQAIKKRDNTIYIVMDSFLSLGARLIEVTGDFISDGIGGFFGELSQKIDGNLRLSTTLWQTHGDDGVYHKEYAPLLLLGNSYQDFNVDNDVRINKATNHIEKEYIKPLADNAVAMIQYLKSQENIKRFIGNRLDGILDFIKDIPSMIKDLLRDAIDFLKTAFEFINALLVGIINSIVDLLKSVVDILQLVFVFSGFVINEIGKRALNPISTISSTMELLENAFETIRKTFKKANLKAFINSIKHLFSKGLDIAVIVYRKILSVGDIKIFPSDVGYYLGYIVGWIAQEVAIFLATAGGGTIAKGLQGVIKSYTELISLARNVTVRTTKAMGKVVSISMESLVNLFKKIREIAGDIPTYFKMVDDFVDEMIEGLKKRNNVSQKDSTEIIENLDEINLDWMDRKHKIGSLGGRVLNAKQIKVLRDILLEKYNVQLIAESSTILAKSKFKTIYNFKSSKDLFKFMANSRPPKVGSFDYNSRQLILSKGTTEIVAFHEISHVKHWHSLGDNVYKSTNILEREMYVWKEILKNKNRWTQDELADSLRYINNIRVRNFRLKPLSI
jgi:hypothetical protein